MYVRTRTYGMQSALTFPSDLKGASFVLRMEVPLDGGAATNHVMPPTTLAQRSLLAAAAGAGHARRVLRRAVDEAEVGIGRELVCEAVDEAV